MTAHTIDTRIPYVRRDQAGRDKNVKASFPIYDSGFEIREDEDGVSFVIECVEPFGPDGDKDGELIQLVPEKKWHMLKSGDSVPHRFRAGETIEPNITVGINNDVEETLSYDGVNNIKSIYTIYKPQPNNEIVFRIKSEKSVRIANGKRGARLTDGFEHVASTEDDHVLISNGTRTFKFMNPDNGVKLLIENGFLKLVLPNDITYPFTFDPSVAIGNVGGVGVPASQCHLTRARMASNNKWYLVVNDTSQDGQLYESTDNGVTWVHRVEFYTNCNVYAVAVKPDGSQCALLYIDTAAASKPLFLRYWTLTGGLTGAVQVQTNNWRPQGLDIACDANDVYHITWTDSNTGKVWYTNSDESANWPYGPMNLPHTEIDNVRWWDMTLWVQYDTSAPAYPKMIVTGNRVTLGDYRMARYDPDAGGWQATESEDVSASTYGQATVLDRDNTIHALYARGGAFNIYYCTRAWPAGSPWTRISVGVATNRRVDISVDCQDVITISMLSGAGILGQATMAKGGAGFSVFSLISAGVASHGEHKQQRLKSGSCLWYAKANVLYFNFEATNDYDFCGSGAPGGRRVTMIL